jgi:hypothetical protein
MASARQRRTQPSGNANCAAGNLTETGSRAMIRADINVLGGATHKVQTIGQPDDGLSQGGAAGSRGPGRGWGRENSTLELLGAPKSGFKLSADVSLTSIVLTSRLDPALLYLVVGAAVLLGLIGAALAAPARVVLEAGLFAALFSPIALFLVISAIRLRSTCTIDLAGDSVRLRERRYLGLWQRNYRLEDVGSVLLLPAAPPSFLGTVPNFLLCVALPDGAYLLGESPSEESMAAPGRLLAEFLGVPFERHTGAAIVATGRRRFMIGVLLYAIPVTAAVAWLSISIPDRGTGWVFPTILVAIVLSQVGAILTLLYYRRHVPEPAGANAHTAAGADPPLPVVRGDQSP